MADQQAKWRVAIDIGTNSVKMLVIDPRNTWIRDDDTTITRLGAGMVDGRLAPEAILRTLDALASLKGGLAGSQAHIVAVATAAVRKASNAAELLGPARDILGVPVQVLSGEEEAALSFAAVSLYSRERGIIRVVDVGGGSVEVATGISGATKPTEVRSLPVGAVTLTEKATDRGAKGLVLCELREHAQVALDGFQARPSLQRLYGVGGTVVALARYIIDDATVESSNGLEVTLPQLDDATRHLHWQIHCCGQRPFGERSGVIVAGLVLLSGVMRRCGAEVLVVSTRGLRHALVEDRVWAQMTERARLASGEAKEAAPGEQGWGQDLDQARRQSGEWAADCEQLRKQRDLAIHDLEALRKDLTLPATLAPSAVVAAARDRIASASSVRQEIEDIKAKLAETEEGFKAEMETARDELDEGDELAAELQAERDDALAKLSSLGGQIEAMRQVYAAECQRRGLDPGPDMVSAGKALIDDHRKRADAWAAERDELQWHRDLWARAVDRPEKGSDLGKAAWAIVRHEYIVAAQTAAQTAGVADLADLPGWIENRLAIENRMARAVHLGEGKSLARAVEELAERAEELEERAAYLQIRADELDRVGALYGRHMAIGASVAETAKSEKTFAKQVREDRRRLLAEWHRLAGLVAPICRPESSDPPHVIAAVQVALAYLAGIGDSLGRRLSDYGADAKPFPLQPTTPWSSAVAVARVGDQLDLLRATVAELAPGEGEPIGRAVDLLRSLHQRCDLQFRHLTEIVQ